MVINNFESNKTDSAKNASSAAYKANCGKWLIGNQTITNESFKHDVASFQRGGFQQKFKVLRGREGGGNYQMN